MFTLSFWDDFYYLWAKDLEAEVDEIVASELHPMTESISICEGEAKLTR